MFASPAFAQSDAEQDTPKPEVAVEEPEVFDQVDEVEEVIDTAPETEAMRAGPETTIALGIALQRTGANALHPSAVGLLVLGLGGFLVMRTSRDRMQA